MDYSLKDAFKSLKELGDDIELKHKKEVINESLEEKQELKEGYIGQTVRDFLEDCIDSGVIGKIVIADNDADDFTVVYEGDFDELPENLLDASFDDFDCGGDKVVINAEEEGEGGTYYSTVADFLDDYNGDEIEIQEEGTVLFSGDKYDIPEELQEYAFSSFDAPEYICINAREIEETNESLITEVYSESIPDWFKNKLKGKYNDLKKKLVNKGIDLNKVEFIEDEIPESAYDPKFKRNDIYPVFLLKPDKWSTSLYIKGINDDDTYSDENYHTKHFGSTPVKKLIDMALNYGYFTTDPSNFNTEKRKERAAAKKGVETRGKGQYKSYNYVSGHRDEETGKWVDGYYDKDDYVWVTPTGEDKSGYKSRFDELKKRLYSADLTNYEEKLNKFEEKLEAIRKEIVETVSSANFKDKSRARGFGRNRAISYAGDLSNDLDNAIGYYMNILEDIDEILSRYEDKDEQNKHISELFSGEHWYSAVQDLRKCLEKAEERIKEYHKEDKTESLEESWVDLRDEAEVEKEKEKLEKEKDEVPVEQVVDPSATIVDELQPSYVGYAILHCSDCKTPIYKKPEELERTESVNPDTGETEYIYNAGFECPHCGSKKGYDLVGQVATLDVGEKAVEAEPVVKDEETKVEEETPTEAPKLETPVEEETQETETIDELKFESLTDFDEVSFDKHINKYLTEVYDNVSSYETTDGSIEGNTIVIEGIVKFNTGKENKTSFRLTLNGNSTVSGLNESFAKEENSYSIEGKVENNTFVTENINYKYKIGEELVEGCTKEPLVEETNMDKIMRVLGSEKMDELLTEEKTITIEEIGDAIIDGYWALEKNGALETPTPNEEDWETLEIDFHCKLNEEEKQKILDYISKKLEIKFVESINKQEESEVVEGAKSNHEFEVGWFEGLTEEEAKQGDPIFKKFNSKKDALDYYELTKDDEGKFGFFINEWDEKGELVDDIL